MATSEPDSLISSSLYLPIDFKMPNDWPVSDLPSAVHLDRLTRAGNLRGRAVDGSKADPASRRTQVRSLAADKGSGEPSQSAFLCHGEAKAGHR